MNYKLDVQKCGYAVDLLTPEILEKLASQITELTDEDRVVLNTLKEKLTLEYDHGL